MKGYRTCGACHNTPSGGTILNDYGRKVVEEWSTYAIDNEMREGIRYDIPYADYKLRIRTLHTPEINIPMLADLEIAGYWRRMFIDLQAGFYSRTMILESRQYFLGFAPIKNFQIRTGFFMPAIGLLSNDHSLPIKQFMGLSRGSEAYTTEIWIWKKKAAQAFISISSNDQRARVVRIRASTFLSKKSELGCNIQGVDSLEILGAFIKISAYPKTYAMYEVDRDLDTQNQVHHLRLGWYPFKGFDLNVTEDKQTLSTYKIGVNWMVRPGFEFSFRGNTDSFNFQVNLFR